MQRQNRNKQRKRQCYQWNQCSAHICQEQEEYDYYKNTSFKEWFLHIADGTFDKTALTEYVCWNFYVRWQVLLQVFQRCFQFIRQFQRTGSRLFGNSHQYGRFSTLWSSSQFRGFRSDGYVRNIFQRDREVVHCLYYRFAKLFCFRSWKYTAYNIFISKFVEHTSICVQVHILCHSHHFSHRNAVMTHPFGIQLNLIFFDISSEYGNLCHSSGRQ